MNNNRISELKEQVFTGGDIDNCLIVEGSNSLDTLRNVPLRQVFEWVKEQAEKDGLKVELTEDKIYFITKPQK